MKRTIKADKKKRDFLLSQAETLALNRTHCLYKNQMYVYEGVSKKETLKKIKEIQKSLNLTTSLHRKVPTGDEN